MSLNSIDEILDNQIGVKLEEIEVNLKKFYYMLVMQIRIFLSEGRYTEENQISLVRAMDIRMAAERIRRICETSKTLAGDDKTIKNILETFKILYKRTFESFIKSDFESATALYNEYNPMLDYCDKIMKEQKLEKDVKKYKSIIDLKHLLCLGKEMSMLIR